MTRASHLGPIGYRDGTEADEAELRPIAEEEGAEEEGAEEFLLHRKILKTGREIWTLVGG